MYNVAMYLFRSPDSLIPFQSKRAILSRINVAGNYKTYQVFAYSALYFCPTFN